MVIKQRAILGEDKESRRGAILNAAEQLMLAEPSRMPSVEEVARAAGLAKGTVYLYFASKEELLLGVQARNSAAFFTDLITFVNQDAAIGVADLMPVLHRHLIQNEGYLPLAVRCFALMDKDVPIETVVATKLRVAHSLDAAARGMQRHFPTLTHDDLVALMLQSYGLALGMWQLLHPVERMTEHMRSNPELKIFIRAFWPELSGAIVALWQGKLADKTRREAL